MTGAPFQCESQQEGNQGMRRDLLEGGLACSSYKRRDCVCQRLKVLSTEEVCVCRACGNEEGRVYKAGKGMVTLDPQEDASRMEASRQQDKAIGAENCRLLCYEQRSALSSVLRLDLMTLRSTVAHMGERWKWLQSRRPFARKWASSLYFHKGAEREYKGVHRFFLSYVYHTSGKAFENFPVDEFDGVLTENPGGISFEWSERGTIVFPPHFFKKILIGKKISISASSLDTSPLTIALAVLQAGAQKHSEKPYL